MRKKILSWLVCVCVAACACMVAACGDRGGSDAGDGQTPDTHVHVMREVPAVAPKCEAEGNEAYYICDGCGKWYRDRDGATEIADKQSVRRAPLDHDWDEGTAVAADCTHDGVTTVRCKRAGCDETRVTRTDKLGHAMQTSWTQSVHTHYHACDRCDVHADEGEHVYTDTDDAVCQICGKITYDTAFTFIGLAADGTAAEAGKETSYEVSAYTGASVRVMIPLTYRDKPITSIHAETFAGNTTVRAVSIPRTVTRIGREAFRGCTSLVEVELQGGVVDVYESAFSGCTSLRNVVFSGKMSRIFSYAFRNTGLRSIHFPDSLTEIGDNAFASCTNLTEITIPATVTKVGGNIFAGCTALQDVKFLAKIDTLDGLFSQCPLRTVQLSDTIRSIGAMSFYKAQIADLDFLPQGLTDIGARAFSGCDKLKTVKLPSSLKKIGVQAFGNCSALECVTGGGNVEQIDGTAFMQCTSLTEIEGLQSVRTIGVNAFYNCEKLSRVAVGNALTDIGEKAFYYCEALTSFTFGTSVQSIGASAFRCAGLTSVRLGSSVRTIGAYAFANISSLVDVTISAGVTSIGEYAFYGCEKLQKAACDSPLGIGMFWDDAALQTVTIGSGATSMGEAAFHGCTGLTGVTFESTIGWAATQYDKDGTTVTDTATPEVSADLAANAALVKQYADYAWTR